MYIYIYSFEKGIQGKRKVGGLGCDLSGFTGSLARTLADVERTRATRVTSGA